MASGRSYHTARNTWPTLRERARSFRGGPLVTPVLRDRIRRRLADEIGRLSKEAPTTIALAYPSPYSSAMSSLGYQRIYRAIMETEGLACERVFLDDEAETDITQASRPMTYE